LLLTQLYKIQRKQGFEEQCKSTQLYKT